MGHLLKQPYANDTLALSELGMAELILVYMSQFNNLPWRIPLCVDKEFKGSFSVTERLTSLPTSCDERIELQRERAAYEGVFFGEQFLPKRVYEIDVESALNILLAEIVHSRDKKALSKKLMERLYSIRPSNDFSYNAVSAVSPYKRAKMDFWLAFQSEVAIDVEQVFVYKKDLVHDLKQTILLLEESCPSKDDLKALQKDIAERIKPNSLDNDFFPIAEALVNFTFKKKRLPYQSGVDRRLLWRLIAVAVAKFKSRSEDSAGEICYLQEDGKKVRIYSENVVSDVKKTYYSKLLAELAVSFLPEADELC